MRTLLIDVEAIFRQPPFSPAQKNILIDTEFNINQGWDSLLGFTKYYIPIFTLIIEMGVKILQNLVKKYSS